MEVFCCFGRGSYFWKDLLKMGKFGKGNFRRLSMGEIGDASIIRDT